MVSVSEGMELPRGIEEPLLDSLKSTLPKECNLLLILCEIVVLVSLKVV